MTVNSASIGAEWFLNGIATLQQQQVRTQGELSSGYRIQDAADSPGETPDLIDLGSSLAVEQNWQSDLGQVQTEVNSADSALTSAIQLLDNARTLAVQGANATSTTSDRQNLAAQIQSIQQQVVAIANTQVAGRYIFGGDQA